LAVKKTVTYADLEALPPHLVGEIIDGELIRQPSTRVIARPRHQPPRRRPGRAVRSG